MFEGDFWNFILPRKFRVVDPGGVDPDPGPTFKIKKTDPAVKKSDRDPTDR